jgi:subtilase family serine protease
VTDGTVFNITNHTVGLGDLESGGIFGFDMILQSIAPRIIGYDLESPVYDTGDATRRFNVTIDQAVNVTWLINGSPVHTNWSVTDASYTHANVAVGVWNVSARASNGNGTAVQKWIWNVTTLLPPVNRGRMPEYSGSNTTEPVLLIIYGWVFHENGSVCRGHAVNISNPNTDMQWTAETHPDHHYYQLVLDAANVNESHVLQIDASKDGVPIDSTEHIITQKEISDGAAIVNLNGLIDLTVSDPISFPRYFCAGRNSTIMAVIVNEGTPYTGGFEASLFANGTLIDTTDVPSVDPGGTRSVGFNWMPDHEGNYTIVVMADSGRMIGETDESNNNRSAEICVRFADIDLAITDEISLNKTQTPLDGDIIRVDAAIENQGNDTADNFSVVFYDDDVAFHTEIMSLNAGDSDTVSARWNASYGEHDIRVIIDPDDRIGETNETNNERSLGVSVGCSSDFTITNVSFALDGLSCSPLELEWGKNVTMNATVEAVNHANRGRSSRVKFYRDADCIGETEVLFKTGNSTRYATVEWHIKDAYSIGDLNMTAIIDPDGEVYEPDESNNEMVIPIYVKASDFTVTNITADRNSVIFGETVELNATIENLGSVAGTVDVAFMARSTDVSENRDISIRDVSVDAGGKAYISIDWDTSKTNLAGNCTVTVRVDPDGKVSETDEGNNSMSMAHSIFVDGTDLAVCDIILDPDEIYQGDVVNVSALLENRGAFDASDFSVEFYTETSDEDYYLINSTNISSLSADGSIYVNATWNLSNASIAIHTITVKIDHCDNPENDVGNNKKVIQREVDMPWEVVNISFPRFLEEGEDVTIAATVRNKGNRAGIASVEFYLDDNLFEENELYVDANSTNSTEVVWNTRLPFIGPTNIRTNHWIRVDAGDHIWGNQDMTIVPADLTVDISLNSDYDMIVTARNNEDRTVNTTLWIYDVDHTVYTISGSGTLKISNPDALNMSAHFFGEIDHSNVGRYEVYDDDDNLLDDSSDKWMAGHYGPTPIDAWSGWGAGSNITIRYERIEKPHGDTGNATIESGALLDIMPVTLTAGERKNFTIEWNVTKRNHTLWAQLGGTNDSIDLNFDIDLAINVSMNDTVLDGDQETITADITNLGHGNAGDFKVMFFNDTNLFCTENITSLDSNATTTVTAIWTADTWNESERRATLNHTIRIEIDPCGNTDINESNNHTDKIVRVNPTRDFSVTDITFFMNNETLDPMDLRAGVLTTINVTIDITNFASCGGSINVSWYLDNYTEPTNTTTVPFPADNGTVYAEFEWKIDTFGNHTVTVIADPENEILELNESNNASGQSVYIRAPDLVVEEIIIDPERPEVGEMVNITATVGNQGNKNASDVTVRFIDESFTDGEIHAVEYMLDSPHPVSADYTHTWTISHRGAHKMRVHFTKIDLCIHTTLKVNEGRIAGGNITNLTTDWVDGDIIEVYLRNYGGEDVWGFNIDRYEYMGCMEDVQTSLAAGDMKNMTVRWNATPAGQHTITAVIDLENTILESNESNNELSGTMIVQGPDLTVSDMRLTVNGTEINATETVITAGEVVNISAIVTNIGIKPARNFNVSFWDDTEIANKTNLSLNVSESVNVSATWNASIGNYTIDVTADPENRIHETNESNNTAKVDVSVQGADLVVTDFAYTVMPPNNATANDTGGRLYDTDIILINATIANQGILPADNFSAHIFYGKWWLGDHSESPYLEAQCWERIEKTLDGAGCMYVKIRNAENIEGNITIYDRNDSIVARPECDGWFFVEGDEANVHFNDVCGVGFNMSFYAGDSGDFQRYDNISIGTGKSENLTPMLQQVFTIGNPVIGVFVDPLNNVSENSEENNHADHALTVHPSRDFAVNNMRLIHNGSEIGVNDTILDGDNVTVDLEIRMSINESDPYHEYRMGIVDIDITDEREWARAQPRYESTRYGYAYVIGYPGADAMRVHFSELDVSSRGVVEIRDKNGTLFCTIKRSTPVSPWVNRDEIYLYRVRKPTVYEKHPGCIVCNIDKYQYRKINRTTVELAANETAHIPARFTMSAGNHTIHAITDPDDRIGEINESNNKTNEMIYAEPCHDPAAVNITFSTELPSPGSAVDVTATVANRGNRTATFTVDLYATKFEYRPCESPHPDYDGKDRYDDLLETITTYPEANRTGVHFVKIVTDCGDVGLPLCVCDRGGNTSVNYYKFNGSDVWAWVKGDLLTIDTEVVCNPYCCPWGFHIDTVAHNVTLNRTTVILGPGKTADITGILPNVRIGYRSINYTVTAVVDQDNIIFETDESNNEVSRELIASCPDLTVGERLHFDDDKAMAVIKNIGTCGVEDVEVRFWHDVDYIRYKKEHFRREHSGMKFPPRDEEPVDIDDDSDEYPSAVRVHFKELTVHRGTLRVWNSTKDAPQIILDPGDYSDTWVEVEGRRCRIYYDSAYVKIDRYEYAKDESVGDISVGSEKAAIPWTKYEEPYNLTIEVDPGDDITESNEDNNNETVLIYADLRADWIEFVSPGLYSLSLDAEKFIINGHITATFPVSDFNVTLEVRNLYPNGTIGDIVFNITKYVEEPFSAERPNKVQFEFDPEEKFEVGGNYTVSLIADSTGDICESNDLYLFGEDNNVTSMDIYVYNSSGYTGGGDLINVAKGEVCGKVVYTVGNSRYDRVMEHGEERTVRYPETIPDDVGDIKFARLFVYWFTYHKVAGRWIPELADVDVTFNDHTLKKAGNYSDNPGATGFDYGYGLYSYDVTDYANKGGNAATVKNNADWGPYHGVGVHAIGLLVVYEDEGEPLTKYWVNEGADIMMAANSRHPTGLPSGDCITTAIFDDVERNDTENVCATLLTVLGMYVSYDKSDLFSVKGDSLEFNGRLIGSPIDAGYWKHYSDSRIALTSDEWDDVTDYLKRGNNLAEIHSKGNYMLANNVFLRLIFPPDLNVIDLDAPDSTVVGAHHPINVTIRNDGRSDAHDFNVTFHIDGKQMVRIPHLDLPAGNSTTIHLYNWTPMMLVHVYNLTAAADVLSGEDWTEIETDNNAMTKYVTIEEGGFGNQTGPRGTGGGSNPTGGEYTEKVTGRVMQGIKDFLSFGGGGGAGMFSLTEWIMKGAVWLVLLLFVCSGYFMEQRSYGRVSGGYAGGL